MPLQARSTNVSLKRKRIPAQHTILFDYNPLADVHTCIRPTLARSTESLRTILGKSGIILRRNTLSIGKCYQAIYSFIRKKMEILINTKSLTLRIPDDKCKDLVNILLTTWNISRKSFTPYEVTSIIGLVVNLDFTTY